MQAAADPMLEGMRVRRSQSVHAPGFVFSIVEASFESDGTREFTPASPVLLMTVRGGSRSGLRQLDHLKMNGSTPPGRLTLIPAGMTLRGWCGGKASAVSFVSAVLDPAALAELIGDGDVPQLMPRLGAEDPDLAHALGMLRREVENPGYGSRLLFNAFAAEIAGFIVRNHSLRGEEQPVSAARALSSGRLRLVKDYLEQHLAQDTPLAELAAMADLSTFHFCRAFKQATGQSPHRYRIERRVERAKQLLADPDHPVAAIAAACGFASASHFATTFSRMTGRSPTRFRREL